MSPQPEARGLRPARPVTPALVIATVVVVVASFLVFPLAYPIDREDPGTRARRRAEHDADLERRRSLRPPRRP